MVNVEEAIHKNLEEGIMIQLATVGPTGRPWVSTLYYVADERANIYWISKPDTRHSQEVAANPNVAIAVPLDANPGSDNVGLQAEGQAGLVTDEAVLRKMIQAYADKYSTGEDYVANFLSGKEDRWLYCLMPSLVVLFDEKNFPDQPSQQWRPSGA